MTEKQLQNKREKIIARIPQLNPIKSPNYKSVMDELNTLVWEEMDDPLTDAPGCSCKTDTGIYHIFATDILNGLAKDQLMMHEAGHCVMQHLRDNTFKHQQAENQIKAKWDKFKAHIDTEGHEDDELSANFIQMILNICMDLEINGKYWTKNEFDEVRQRISDASLARFITMGNEEQLNSIEKWMDENPNDIHKFGQGLYPTDFGFPVGLPYMSYLQLILSQPNEFMDKFNNMLDEQQRQMGAAQEGKQGQGSGNGNGNKNSNNSENGQNGNKKGDGKNSQQNGNGKKKLKASIIKANAENGKGKNGEKKALAAANKAEREKAQSGQQGQGQTQGAGSGGDDADEWVVPGDGISENEESIKTELKLDKSVIKFIEKNCIGKSIQRTRQDNLYNYNRGKSSGGVLRSRMTTTEEYRPGNLVALIDVSGSVEIDLVKALLSEMIKYKSKFGRNSKIILWDTSLVKDLMLNKSNLKHIKCGGGTDIAKGIKYANQYLKGADDKLCIISDFEDYLESWAEELKQIKGDTFAICWGGTDGSKLLIESARNKKALDAAKKLKVINVG